MQIDRRAHGIATAHAMPTHNSASKTNETSIRLPADWASAELAIFRGSEGAGFTELMPEMFCYSITSPFLGMRKGLFFAGSGLRQFAYADHSGVFLQ
ncbi:MULTISPECIES: hypothetical protein [unclassified Pseudomonas]|uniref:hypothetical protein n=1 Tax=unclassified Pseudomonas TaxID=196821 RepID=UPI0025CE4E79|nr:MULTISPECIES: hypothetical protein [unclassified Pseudomonas]